MRREDGVQQKAQKRHALCQVRDSREARRARTPWRLALIMVSTVAV